MLWSALFIPTLRENPTEVEGIGQQLLFRAGYIRRVSGMYAYLLLGQRSLLKIQQIVREEAIAIGGQEMLLPVIAGSETTKAITSIVRGELRSYKQLPQIWYQIQTKFQEEPRSKSGLLRVRQLLTKAAYTFDLDEGSFSISYQKHYDAYRRIFARCGLEYITIDNQKSHEFLVPSDRGEYLIVHCNNCRYRANLENAISKPNDPAVPDPEGDLTPEAFHTPGLRTIGDVSAFTNLPETSQMKSVVMMADQKPVLVMVRGDHQLSEIKLISALHAAEVRPAYPEEMVQWFGAGAGSLGPVGVKNMRVLIDNALKGRRNLITGANKDDFHLKHVTPGRDFEAEYFDLRQVATGDSCSICGSALAITKATEIGRMFKLGRYPPSVDLRVLGEDGREITPIMGSYSIGIERILSCAVELYHDADGIFLPAAIAPFSVTITPVNYADSLQKEAADLVYTECSNAGIDALLDDRDQRPGVKFKDADLIGIPYRITIGKKLNQGKIEFIERRTRASQEVLLQGAVAHLQKKLDPPLSREAASS